jgi:hypothetical protein
MDTGHSESDRNRSVAALWLASLGAILSLLALLAVAETIGRCRRCGLDADLRLLESAVTERISYVPREPQEAHCTHRLMIANTGSVSATISSMRLTLQNESWSQTYLPTDPFELRAGADDIGLSRGHDAVIGFRSIVVEESEFVPRGSGGQWSFSPNGYWSEMASSEIEIPPGRSVTLMHILRLFGSSDRSPPGMLLLGAVASEHITDLQFGLDLVASDGGVVSTGTHRCLFVVAQD